MPPPLPFPPSRCKSVFSLPDTTMSERRLRASAGPGSSRADPCVAPQACLRGIAVRPACHGRSFLSGTQL